MKFESLDVIIMDVSGRTVIQRNCKENADLKFDLSSSPEGCYFVKILRNNGRSTKADHETVKGGAFRPGLK